MSDVLKIALAQVNPMVGDVAGNVALIKAARAEAAKRRAEDRLNKPASDMDMERARISLLRAIARLDIAKHNRPRR